MSTELEKAESLFKQFKMKEAYSICQKLAEEGEPRAMYFMGIFSRLFLGVGKYDPAASAAWFKKGMKAGDVLCGISCAYMEEPTKRSEEMKKWLPKAEQMMADGDVFALDDTADCYFYGIGTEKDEKKALANLEKAAKAGYWLAQFDLACQYDDNGHYEADYKKAMEGYRKSAETGYSEASYRMAFHYAQGAGCDKNEDEAIDLWKKSWKQGNAAAANALGFVYSFGSNGRKDDKAAFEWFEKGAKAGFPMAAGNLGNCYYYGRGVKKDLQEAKKWYRAGAAGGIPSSMLQLGVILRTEHKNEDAFKAFLVAANMGYAPAMNWVAACYEHGIGIEKDQGKELFWLKRAAGMGSQEAIQTLQRKYPQNMLVKTNRELSDEDLPKDVFKEVDPNKLN